MSMEKSIRAIVLDLLLNVYQEQSYSNLVLNKMIKKYELDSNDVSLITNIFYGTIQNEIYLNYQLRPYLKKEKINKRDYLILIMSIYQLFFLDKIPEYAIVNEAVALAKKTSEANGRFVNGVLRNIIRNGKKEVEGSDELTTLSIVTSHPLWLVKMLNKHYGLEITKKICEINNEPPLLCARINTLISSYDKLSHLGKPGKLSKDALILNQGNFAQLEEFLRGEFTIQDESSQLVADFVDPKKGDYILDMCAAPGSKSTHLAQRMNNEGMIISNDIHEHRVNLIKQNAQRLHVDCIKTICEDALTLDQKYSDEFDKVLLDAPCSGFGVIRRKPDIKIKSKQNDLDSLIKLQADLLDVAANLVKTNGNLIYSTCTINKKENDLQVSNFLKKHPNFTLLRSLQIFPFEYDSDGFFIAKFVKNN